MVWQFNPYAIPLFLSGIFLFSLAAIAHQRASSLAARLFVLFVVSVAGFNIAYGIELLAADLATMMVWLKVEYIFRYIPTLWLFFILAYTGHEKWLTRRHVALALVVPILWTLIAWTNEHHHLNWATTGTETLNGMALFSRTYGVGFYVGIGYDYAVAVVAAAIMVTAIVRFPALYRGQIKWLLLAALFPLLGSILTTLRLTPVPHLDLLPFGFALICVPVAWSMFRHRLFDITPLAHNLVIHSMQDAVLVLDTARRIVDVNPTAAALAGFLNHDMMIGLPLPDAFPSQASRLDELIDSGQSHAELHLLVDAEDRYFEPRLSTVRDQAGRLRGHVVVLRDITDHKLAQETINRYAAELEARNHDLDAFSHTVAHDLKAPVTSVVGYSQFLLEATSGALDAETTRQYLMRINQSGYKMAEMIEGLLVLAQLRQTETTLEMVDMTAVAQSAISRFRTDIELRGIDVRIDNDLPPVCGRAVWLEEVFANLISNAIKYIGQNNLSPCIVIGGSDEGETLRYEVRDNGLGINEKSQKRLFEMFARFHRNEANGIGLGLSIVLRIVQKLGGRVGVESTPGTGSTFWFTLPAREPPPPPASQPEAEQAETHLPAESSPQLI